MSFFFSTRLTLLAGLCLVVVLMPLPARAQPPQPPQPPLPVPKTDQTPMPQPSTPLPEPILVAPPPLTLPYKPFPHLPDIRLDEAHNGLGIAQKLTRERGLQARLLWIDATANLDRVNTAAKIAELVARAKSAGFTTLVFDIKPIIGQTLYPSQYAPKMTQWVRPWKTQNLPLNFDPLKEMATQAKTQGMELVVSMNAFSEGHREFPGQGPGDSNPQWQTVLYEPTVRIRPAVPGSLSYPVMNRANFPASDAANLTLYTDRARLKPSGDALIAVLDSAGTVLAHLTQSALGGLLPRLPQEGAALVAENPTAIRYLRETAPPGTRLILETVPAYVRIGQRSDRQVPLMTSPHSLEVRQRLLNMITEVVTSYPIDGLIFDDRLRYAAINADFSDEARRQFEQYLGKPINWPDDVFRYEYQFPSLRRSEVPGLYYDAWLTFRALTMRNIVAEIVRTVKTLKPALAVATYVGSWYPDYPDIGANWAAPDLTAGFRFLNDSYRQTGWSGLVDFVVTGCYYETATLLEAAAQDNSVGDTVEAAGQFSNRAVNDQTFVYAGLQLDKYKNRPEDLRRALQAAAATTQGIMVFDLSHEIEPFWPVFTEVFQKPTPPPHRAPGALAELRALHAAWKATGLEKPPVILYRGTAGTGF